MDGDYTWDMSGYYNKYSFTEDRLTMRQVERIFQLEPEPPKAAFINDYIIAAVMERDYIYFSFFPASL